MHSQTDGPERREEVEEPMLLPPPDYSDSSGDRPIKPSTPSPQNTVNTTQPLMCIVEKAVIFPFAQRVI